MQDSVQLSLEEIYRLSEDILVANGASSGQAAALAATVTAAERDDCPSHGIYRLLGCVHSIRVGKIVPDAVPEIVDLTPALTAVKAGRGFAPLAFNLGMPQLVAKARSVGIAALAINDCFHYSALWAEVEPLAEQGLVAFAFTSNHAWVAPAGGHRPLFGTNPMAFGWPRPAGHPFVFDFATSAAARGEIELRRRAAAPIPPDWAVDAKGRPTTDAGAALEGAMLPFGGYKGSALAAMIELIAGPLIGDLTSVQSLAYDDGAGAAPLGGELVIAIDPTSFLGAAGAPHVAAEALFADMAGQAGRLPSQRRYAARERTLAEGVRIPRRLYDDLHELLPIAPQQSAS